MIDKTECNTIDCAVVDQAVSGGYDKVSYDFSATPVPQGKETESMSSLPSHRGFFFRDAFICISVLAHPYHFVNSLLLPDIVPHTDPMSARVPLFMIPHPTVLTIFIGPRGASAQAIHPHT